MIGTCNLCGFPVIRIGGSRLGTRCVRCRSTQIHRAVGMVLSSLDCTPTTAVYELSARGALYRHLKRQFPQLACSEYFEDVPPGQRRGGVLCQDVHHLEFATASFDLVTSTEVFEHVADDQQGFREIFRVLRPGGRFVFTVPIDERQPTVERCRQRGDGQIDHYLTPNFHGDRIRGRHAVLVFRDYGQDIIDRLGACGFQTQLCTIVSPRHKIDRQPVLVARKDRA